MGTVLCKQLSSIQVELIADDRAPLIRWLSLATARQCTMLYMSIWLFWLPLRLDT